jgi:2-dehydro-3-deoxygalactonokinase
VPGLLYDDDARPDVMRGEEVRILGAMALGFVAEGAGPDLVCLPGTHSKWAETGNARIRRFRTVMTGDILAALKAHSILSDLLAAPAEQTADTEAAFLAGVDHMLEAADLTAELFTVRARVLTGRLDAAGAAAQISGLLIGADIRAGLGRLRTDVVPLIGDAALCNRFALALARAGRETSILDGETAFVAGAMALARHLELAA